MSCKQCPPAAAAGPPYAIPVAPLTNFYAQPPGGGGSGAGGSGAESGSGGGSSGEDDCRCGPDVTYWFASQSKLLRRFVDDGSHFVSGLNFLYPSGSPDAVLLNLVRKLKFENAGLVTNRCPNCKSCTRTVTLCGACIDVTELGNLAYGYIVGRNFPLTLWGGGGGVLRRGE